MNQPGGRNSDHADVVQPAHSVPSLSIVVVASGSTTALEPALETLIPQVRRLQAELIVASAGALPSAAAALCRAADALVIECPTGSSRAELCEAGATRAGSDVLVIRDADGIGDASFLACFQAIPDRQPRQVAARLDAPEAAAASAAAAPSPTTVDRPLDPVGLVRHSRDGSLVQARA